MTSINTSRPENQIVPFPRFAVRCACGYAHDSNAETREKAVEEIAAQHATALSAIAHVGPDTRHLLTATEYPR